ncbi:phosphotransferase [Streptomyces sp. S.PB5]|uniref:phosphotransferase family protein n=1 Tax=Streptomyces sp. S.PB5 TaxID=3020844 RepID=UPI0025B09A69|nr:phosphotransferase [Streptomyces sp. S.PB5]MDN3025650.1 phosphotransferase [Streptomyces sp. S.PB5]
MNQSPAESVDEGSLDAAVISKVWPYFHDVQLAGTRRLKGRSHRVYECTDARGGAVVVRLSAPHRARFGIEASLVQRCRDAGVPVPAIRYVGNQESAYGPVSIMVQDKVAGETLREHATRVGPERARDVVRQAGEILAEIHQVNTTEFGSVDANLHGTDSKFGDWFIDRLEAKLNEARRIEPTSGRLLDRAMALMRIHRAMLDDCSPKLLHGDYSPDNLIVEDGCIAAVIDWEAAKSGPPEMDIGWWDCFFESPLTQASELISGYERRIKFEPERLLTLRHLAVLRIMIGHFSWTLSVGDPEGIKHAAERIELEVDTADSWAHA